MFQTSRHLMKPWTGAPLDQQTRTARTENTCPCPRCTDRRTIARHHAKYGTPKAAPAARLIPHVDTLRALWPVLESTRNPSVSSSDA